MKEKYTFNTMHFAILCGTYGRGAPGLETNSAGYIYPFNLLPAEAGRGQPPPGEEVITRGREPCGEEFKVYSSKFRVPGFGFRVSGFGFGV